LGDNYTPQDITKSNTTKTSIHPERKKIHITQNQHTHTKLMQSLVASCTASGNGQHEGQVCVKEESTSDTTIFEKRENADG